MQSFEHVCKVALESENFVVSTNVKFLVSRPTKQGKPQLHGIEADLVGIRADKLVIAEVKSNFGSKGVRREHFVGLSPAKEIQKNYKLFNERELREEIVRQAAEKYGFRFDHVEVRLYAGNIRKNDREAIKNHLQSMNVRLVTLDEILNSLLDLAATKTYVDDPVLMTVKAFIAGGRIQAAKPPVFDDDDE